VFTNLFFLGFMLLAGLPSQSGHAAMTVRTVVGIFLAYLAGTSLFRIYPQAVPFRARTEELTDKDRETVEKIRNLIDLQKVYHEPAYNRSDLARELNLSEGAVSRVVNIAYGQTLPQLINERRVEDAKRLLAETDATIKVVAEEVGFNSLASFNRVFKEIAGCNPSDFRHSMKKAG
jgi:AraC-like DNA-binding protein